MVGKTAFISKLLVYLLTNLSYRVHAAFLFMPSMRHLMWIKSGANQRNFSRAKMYKNGENIRRYHEWFRKIMVWMWPKMYEVHTHTSLFRIQTHFNLITCISFAKISIWNAYVLVFGSVYRLALLECGVKQLWLYYFTLAARGSSKLE